MKPMVVAASFICMSVGPGVDVAPASAQFVDCYYGSYGSGGGQWCLWENSNYLGDRLYKNVSENFLSTSRRSYGNRISNRSLRIYDTGGTLIATAAANTGNTWSSPTLRTVDRGLLL